MLYYLVLIDIFTTILKFVAAVVVRVGQFVSATSRKAYTGGGGRAGGNYGFSRDSRETTLANGRKRIQEVGMCCTLFFLIPLFYIR